MSKEQWGHGYNQAILDAFPGQIAEGVKAWLVRNEGLGEIEKYFRDGVADGVYRWLDDNKTEALVAMGMGQSVFAALEARFALTSNKN